MSVPADSQLWGPPDRAIDLLARNVSTRYLAIFVDGAIGLMMLPFNVAHLGPSAYGLWALTSSVTWFFGVLDLGYGGALVKFVAQYRALRDRSALNEILSTVALVFAGLGLVCWMVTALVAWQVGTLFNIAPEQERTAQHVLLIVGAYLSVRFPLSVYGALVYGFQRYYLNNAVSIGVSIAVAGVNVAVLSAGYGLVTLVAATTAVRLLSLGILTWNAYRVFPGLQVRLTLFRRPRLVEVTSLSVYMFVLNWAAKLNYSSDTLIIGAMLDTTAVAAWTVGLRLSQVAQQLAGQLSNALFPAVVDSDAAQRQDRLQMILVEGTKLSLAFAVPLCVGAIVLADPLIRSWVGAQFASSVLPTQILLVVVLVRISTGSAGVILRGAGQHKLLTYANVITAVVNIVLTIVLIRPFGLIGVAFGTMIPVTLASALVLYPAACRRVGVPIALPLVRGMWPPMWPAVGMIGILWLGRRWPPTSLFEVALHLAAASLVYALLFVGAAISSDERRLYWMKLRDLVLLSRRAPAAP
jgi:O-antigen/teichoic acid export membrane protein